METVTISKEEYQDLQRQSLWAQALDNAGVDNWQGVEFAQDEYRELLRDNKLDDE